MLYSLSPEARQKLGTVSKQIRAKLGGTDCRLVAIIYAIFVCQTVQKSSSKIPGLDSAFQVKLPNFLSDIFVTDYLLNTDLETSLEKQSVLFKVKRIIKDLAKVNDSSIDLFHTDKLLAINDENSFWGWVEKSAEKISFQLLLLENIAPPMDLISISPSLPAEVFNLLIKTSEAANVDTNSNTIPADLANLVAQAFPLKKGDAVLDLSFGLGNMVIASAKLSEGVRFFGQEADSLSTLLGWLRIQLTPHDNEVTVKVGDALSYSYELSSNVRPIDLAYVYSCSQSNTRDDIKFYKNYDDVELKKLLVLKTLNVSRLQEAEKSLKEIKSELDIRQKGLRLVDPTNLASIKKYEDSVKLVERKMEQASRVYDELLKEYAATNRHMNSIRNSKSSADFSFGETRDSKLIKHALETVHESGTVVAVVSSRNLLSISGLRLLNECLKKNSLDTVVELPRGSAGTNDRIALLVFRKNRKDKDVLFVDATKFSAANKSSNDPVDQIVKEVLYFALTRRTKPSDFSEDFISRLAEMIKNRTEDPSVSIKVSFENLESEDKSSGTIITDLRPQKYLAESPQPKESIESLYMSLDAAIKQTVETSKALQNARSELGLERLPTLFSKPSADRPKIT